MGLCFFGKHVLELMATENEMWLECKYCDHKEDVPKDREEDAYEMLRNNLYIWNENKNKKENANAEI